MDKLYMGKIFKPINIPNYSNYMISKDGDIFSKDRNRLIKHIIDEYGTHKIRLQTDRHCESHKFRICDLLLKTWNINVDSKSFPNIIKEDKEYNNRVNRTEMIYDNKLFKNVNLPSYENYMINDIGDVYTKRSGKLMVPKLDKDGYLNVGLYNTITNKRMNIRVHRIVMYTFGELPPNNDDTYTVDHIDGNLYNNHISNLRWLSRSENSSPINKHSLKFKEYLKRIRTSDESLREKYDVDSIIRDYFTNKMTKKEIYKKYSVPDKKFSDMIKNFMCILFSKGPEFGINDITPENEYGMKDFTNFMEDEA